MSFDTRLLAGVGVLAAVTETGNFARASEMLGLTPSAVSRAVSRLEARVGVRLFDRNPREVSLTFSFLLFSKGLPPHPPVLRQRYAADCGSRWTHGSRGRCWQPSCSNSCSGIHCCRSIF
jgi:hypothetical protein